MSHTKGPWKVVCGSVYKDDICISNMDRNEPKTRPTERDKNAHLISAAPEMLEHLEYLRQKIDFKDPVELGMIEAIIKKAKGSYE